MEQTEHYNLQITKMRNNDTGDYLTTYVAKV